MNIRANFTAIISVGLAMGALLICGCVSHDYLGEHLAKTDQVVVMYNLTATPAGYRVMGEDKAEAPDAMSAEDVVKDIVKKAQEVGADAVSIKGMKVVVTGTDTSTSGDVNTTGSAKTYDTHHGEHTVSDTDAQYSENSQTTVEKDKIITATFLKRATASPATMGN